MKIYLVGDPGVADDIVRWYFGDGRSLPGVRGVVGVVGVVGPEASVGCCVITSPSTASDNRLFGRVSPSIPASGIVSGNVCFRFLWLVKSSSGDVTRMMVSRRFWR